MPKPTKGPRLGGGPAHERLLLANLAAALFTHKSIKTTETKAKRLRPLAERLITFAKRGDLHARRRVLSVIGDKEVVHVLFTEIAPLVADREGGYTRITKVGNRKGDNAPLAVIELVEFGAPAKKAVVKEASKATAKAAPKKADAKKSSDTVADAAPEAAAPVAEETVDELIAEESKTGAHSDAPAEGAEDVTEEVAETTESAAAPAEFGIWPAVHDYVPGRCR